MKTVAVICKKANPLALDVLKHLARFLRERGRSVRVVESGDWEGDPSVRTVPESELVAGADLLVVLGGDGTLIHAAHLLDGENPPVLGINLGTLGFLTEVVLDEMDEVLERVLAGDFTISERKLLQAALVRDGRERLRRQVLNDVVINKTALARILRLEAHIGTEFMTTYRSDGLIVSSPTGSTAYNMSAGGPVLYPTLGAYILTPICPHTFADRPVVLPDELEVDIVLTEANGEVYLTFDGQEGLSIREGDHVRISAARRSLRLIRSPKHNFFQILHRKLGWGQG